MIEKLKEKTGLEVKKGELMKNYTTFRIGGPAKYLVTVNNKADLLKAVTAAKELDLKFFMMGGGSNLLVSDDGFDGFVIKLAGGEPEIKGTTVKCFAGCNLGNFIRKTVEAGLGGLEFAANIPGTIGGAIRGNAGAYGEGVGDYVEEVEVLVANGETQNFASVQLKKLFKEDCGFVYRGSAFKNHPEWIIAEASFRLKEDSNSAEKLEKIQAEWQERLKKQPMLLPSAGCAFKNIEYTDELKKFKDWEVKGKLPAARFIDELDLKGMRIGGAKISEKHANFIINDQDATADDVVQLISLVKTRVRDQFGVQLEEEVQYVGF